MKLWALLAVADAALFLNPTDVASTEESPSKPAVPGAGFTPMTPTSADVAVHKDGFFPVSCSSDASHKFSDNQSSAGQKRYAAQNVNVTIVWYHETVAEKKEMTPRVCFNFCRIQPHMGFFGLVHGRDCYCMPYYQKQEGGEGSDCDLPCPGDQRTMCGGKTKSSIYSMHFCDDLTQDLETAKTAAGYVKGNLTAMVTLYELCQDELQTLGDDEEATFGGSVFASNYFQAAKVRAGELKRLLEKAETLEAEKETLAAAPDASKSIIEQQEYKEGQVINLQEFERRASKWLAEAEKDFGKTCNEKPHIDTYNFTDEYRPIAYFSEYKDVEYEKAACDGEMIGSPMYVSGVSCALACRDDIKCEGFSIFEAGKETTVDATPGLCVLLSSVKAAKIYSKKECEDYRSKGTILNECYYRLSDSKGLNVKFDLDTEWCHHE